MFNKFYFGKDEAAKYGDMIQEKYADQIISKRIDEAEKPGGLIYVAKELEMEDEYVLLKALEGMCHERKAREINDGHYSIIGKEGPLVKKGE